MKALNFGEREKNFHLTLKRFQFLFGIVKSAIF